MTSVNISFGPGITIGAGVAAAGANPLELPYSQLIDTDGGTITGTGWTDTDGGTWSLTPAQVTYYSAIAALNGGSIQQVWNATWAAGSSRNSTPVAVYYPSFNSPTEIVVYVLNPDNPNNSLVGTWNLPVLLQPV
jgi:hypothetical protein